MKKVSVMLSVLSLFSLSILAEGEKEAVPTADQLLEDVVNQLPSEHLSVSGDLLVRRKKGIAVSPYKFIMDLHWGANPSKATYIISENRGKPLESLSVTRYRSGKTEYGHFKGADLSKTDLPDLSEAILDTDVSWMDLTLSFLWWRGGKVSGEEKVIGRVCYIVDVPAPESVGPTVDSVNYSSVRLWVDKKLHVLLQAEGNRGGKMVRKLWVRSFRKINDRWMIKDMEIQGEGSATRTKLTVRDADETK